MRLAVSLLAYLAGQCDEVACRSFLCHDLGVIAQVCRRGNLVRQVGQFGYAAGFRQFALLLKFLGYSQHIDRLIGGRQILDGLEYQAMLAVVERTRLQQVGYRRVGVLLDHHCPEHRFFQLRRLRRHLA